VRLAGLQKSSLIDFPQKLSCVLFLSGCNFHCPYCHNADLVRGENCVFLPEKEACDFLAARAGLLDGVVISGGEPTLHQDLPFLCEKVKKLNYPVKLDTNGSRPEMIRTLIRENLVDYVAMDIKGDPVAYSPVIKEGVPSRDILSSIGLVMESGLPHEFRTTCVKPIVEAKVVEKIARTIQGAALYALQRFRSSPGVLDPEFFEGPGSGCGEEEMDLFRSLAAPWVDACLVR
jgi:pyruvate formate lyase activating enzyme